jgi:UDP-galactopyranose mutase
MNTEFDYLIVGTGLFGSTFAEHALRANKKILMIDERNHIGGNIYTENREGINVHIYGAHIFHTSNKKVWDYINKFCSFNHFINRPKVNYKNKIYSFPINLMTLYQLWGVTTPKEALEKINSVKKPIKNPKNLEDWVLSQVGSEIYEIFIKGYTTKQWQCKPKELPTFIIRRLPIRFNFDDNYFNDCYQGIPIGGYTQIIEKMTNGAKIMRGVDYFENKSEWDSKAKKVVYTGPIDRYFDYKFGNLNYRTLRFEHEHLDIPDFQGNAVVNYGELSTPYTRILEHKHFEFGTTNNTIITKEYPDKWNTSKIPYYPINNEKNNGIYKKYKTLANTTSKTIFGGRLAEYKYYDMHQVIASAISIAEKEFKLNFTN